SLSFYTYFSFFFYYSVAHSYLHSFPTRRSSDLVAEYFRDDEGKDVILFIDNIFRFVQANSEVSALLGRMPSAVGYQPTLGTDIGDRKSTRLNSSHVAISYAVFCLKKKKQNNKQT